MVFFNPFTNDIHKLPYAPRLFEISCFSTPPTSPDCIVIGFITEIELCAWILFVGRGTPWHRIGMDGGVPFSLTHHFRFPTFRGRDVYVLCRDGKVDVFKEPRDNFLWKSVVDQGPRSRSSSDTRYFLVAGDEHLLLVTMGEIGESVEVFRLNDSTQEWEKIDRLRRRTIYICDNTCLCVEAKTARMENKIYFPRLHSENGNLVFYSLETCRYHTIDGTNVQRSFGDLTRTKVHHHPHTWIEPSWS